MASFPDQVSVVTGAASGIGRALAVELARCGCHLALVHVNVDGLRKVEEELSLLGRRVSAHVVDVSNSEQMQNLPAEVLREHDRVDMLINNAGVSLAGPFESFSMADLDWIVNINLWGVIHGCKFFLPLFRQRGAGHIVNIASDFGLFGLPTKTAYCATKFAIRGFSEALRAELYGSGIHLTCVYPGAVDTELIRASRTLESQKRDLEAAFVAQRGTPAEKVAQKIIRGIQKRRARVLIGRETYAIDFMMRFFPNLTQTLVGRFHRRIPFL